MKKIFFSLLFLITISVSFAQTFSIQNDSASVSGFYPDAIADTTYYTLQLTNHLHNLTNSIIPSFWTRDIQYLTSGWTTSCCDPVNCWGDTVNSENFDFPAGMNALVVVDYKPHGHAGLGVIKVKYALQSNSSDSASAIFVAILDISSNTFTIENVIDIKLFPNPAENKLMITATSQMIPTSIEVFNVLGGRISTSVFKEGDNLFSVDINSLKDGFYFLRMKLANGSIITRRFNKV